MPGLTFIFVGRMRERHYTAAFEEYFKRLGAFGKPELREIAEERLPEQPSEREIAQALKRELRRYSRPCRRALIQPRFAWRARQCPARSSLKPWKGRQGSALSSAARLDWTSL